MVAISAFEELDQPRIAGLNKSTQYASTSAFDQRLDLGRFHVSAKADDKPIVHYFDLTAHEINRHADACATA